MKVKSVLAGVAATLALAGMAVAQPYGMGNGMMGGYGGGYGMGPGMTSGYGMGPGMMFGYTNDAYAGLDLTPEQQKAIGGIQEQASKAVWQLMGTMHGQGYHMQGMFGPGPPDEAAARNAFQTMTETQKAMFELQLDAQEDRRGADQGSARQAEPLLEQPLIRRPTSHGRRNDGLGRWNGRIGRR